MYFNDDIGIMGVNFEQKHYVGDNGISRAVLISSSVRLKIQSLQDVHPVEENENLC